MPPPPIYVSDHNEVWLHFSACSQTRHACCCRPGLVKWLFSRQALSLTAWPTEEVEQGNKSDYKERFYDLAVNLKLDMNKLTVEERVTRHLVTESCLPDSSLLLLLSSWGPLMWGFIHDCMKTARYVYPIWGRFMLPPKTLKAGFDRHDVLNIRATSVARRNIIWAGRR